MTRTILILYLLNPQGVSLSDIERGLHSCISSIAQKVETLIVLTLPPIPRLFSKSASDHLVQLGSVNNAIKKICTNSSGINFKKLIF